MSFNRNNFIWRLWQRIAYNNRIDKTAWIGKVQLGSNIVIGPYCIIGANAEHRNHWGVNKGVFIGDGCIITGHVTIDGGVNSETFIWSNCFIMKGVHIGHDVKVYADCTIAPHVVLGGHVTVEGSCNIGMAAVVHQHCTIGLGSMVGMNTTVTKQSRIVPFGKYVGSPAKNIGVNYHTTGTLRESDIISIQDSWNLEKK